MGRILSLRCRLEACRQEAGLGIVRPDDAIRLFAELGLGFRFFQVGLELDQRLLRGQSGRLAAIGWGASLLVAGAASGLLLVLGLVHDFLGVAIALTSTGLGSLMPFLKDSGVLNTRFGQIFLGAGAVGAFGPILAVFPRLVLNRRLREQLSLRSRGSTQIAVRLAVLLLVGLLTLADEFGLDVVLGAVIAGVIAGRYAPREGEPEVLRKVEGLATGFPIIVAVTALQVSAGVMLSENVAALVGAVG